MFSKDHLTLDLFSRMTNNTSNPSTFLGGHVVARPRVGLGNKRQLGNFISSGWDIYVHHWNFGYQHRRGRNRSTTIVWIRDLHEVCLSAVSRIPRSHNLEKNEASTTTNAAKDDDNDGDDPTS